MYPNLKLRMWVTGVRQNRLAQMAGMDETVLSKIINGFREPSPVLRARIAAILECDEEWLFEQAASPDVRRGDKPASH